MSGRRSPSRLVAVRRVTRGAGRRGSALALGAALAVSLAACHGDRFDVVVTVVLDPAAAAAAATIELDVAETTAAGAAIDARTVTFAAADFFASPGETNRVLVRAGADAGAVAVSGRALDAAGAVVATGALDPIARSRRLVEVTVELGPPPCTGAACADAGTDSGGPGTDAAPPACGDGVAAPPELCDGADLAGATCASIASLGCGTLVCAASCAAFDAAGCFDVPPPPVLLAPQNDSYVGKWDVSGSLRPAFVWAPPPVAVPGLTYDLEYAFTTDFTGSTIVTALTATTFTPPIDLSVAIFAPRGTRYYWHVRACAAGCGCSPYSTVWWTNVGRNAYDLDGDAFADVAVGAMVEGTAGGLTGRVYAYDGALGTGFDAAADALRDGINSGDSFGAAVALCDVNGDGFSDLIVGAPLADGTPIDDRGSVSVYLGSAIGPGSVAAATLWGESANDHFGSAVACAADVNGDGVDDFLVGAPQADGLSGDEGKAYLFQGVSGFTPDATPDYVAAGTGAGEALGTSVAGPGDLDDDGYADFAAGGPASTAPASPGVVRVYYGDPAGPVAAGVLVAMTSATLFGTAIAGGDVDADGYSDLVVGAPGDDTGATDVGAVFLFRGGSGAAFDSTSDATISGVTANVQFGASLAVVDYDADGDGDVVVGLPESDAAGVMSGAVWIYPAPALVSATVLSASAASERMGTSVAGAGDLNGDLVADLVVGAPETTLSTGTGLARVYFGATGAIAPTLAGTLPGTGVGSSFGQSVASAATLRSARPPGT
ncbi:MAG TPA: hypothetical protein VG389_08385 [Myxococcota bacterium]|jgi:hypothetical protein|nr:hypothetical protein [Myxococcota bacterium]